MGIDEELNAIQLLHSQDEENYYIGLLGLRHLGWSPFSIAREFICSRKRPINSIEFFFDSDNKFSMYNLITDRYRVGWDKHHIITIDGVVVRNSITCITKFSLSDMDTEAIFASFLRKLFKLKQL